MTKHTKESEKPLEEDHNDDNNISSISGEEKASDPELSDKILSRPMAEAAKSGDTLYEHVGSQSDTPTCPGAFLVEGATSSVGIKGHSLDILPQGPEVLPAEEPTAGESPFSAAETKGNPHFENPNKLESQTKSGKIQSDTKFEQNTRHLGALGGLPQGPEVLQAEEPTAAGLHLSAAETKGNPHSGNPNRPESQTKSEKIQFGTKYKKNIRHLGALGDLPPGPEVIPAEEPTSAVWEGDEFTAFSLQRRNIDVKRIPNLESVPQESDVIEEPPLDIENSPPIVESFRNEPDNSSSSEQLVGAQFIYPGGNESSSFAYDEDSTVHARRVEDVQADVPVTAECILAERQGQEAIRINDPIRNKHKISLKDRRTRILIFITSLLIIALGVGIGVSASRGANDNQSETTSLTSSPTITSQPSSFPSLSSVPTAVPTGFVWTQIGQDIKGTKENEQLGDSVAISKDGNLVAIGSPHFSIENEKGSGRGRVQIYEVRGDDFDRVQVLDGTVDTNFGIYVTFSGDGKRFAAGGNKYNNETGQVQVFEYKSGSWEPLGETIIGDAPNGRFGTCLALSEDGNVLAVGANRLDFNGTDRGSVRIFKYSNGTWSKRGEAIMGENPGDKFGHRLSMSKDGRVVAIGGHQNTGVNGDVSGHIRVYQYDTGEGGKWKQLGQDIDGDERADRFGWSISLSSDGSILASGARFSDGGGDASGDVWSYQYNNETDRWILFGKIAGEAKGDTFGHELSLSNEGNIIAIGALNHNGVNGPKSGYVQIYKYNGQTWTKIGNNIYGKAAGDILGSSVSISGDGTRVVVGASGNKEGGVDSGIAQIYEMRNI